MGQTKCNSMCIGKDCKRRKKLACACGKYLMASPAIEEACIRYANSTNGRGSLAEFECQNAETFFSNYGQLVCDFDYKTSTQYLLTEEEEKQNQEEADVAKENQRSVIILLAMLIIGTLLALLIID